MDSTLQLKISQLFINPVSLGFYDPVSYAVNKYIWRCSNQKILTHYRGNIGNNHLEFSPGTGKLLDDLNIPTANLRLSLVDSNRACLRKSKIRLARYSPNVFQCSILEPLDMIGERFDSICVNHILHCIPRDFHTKGIVFYHLKRLLKSDGVLFGSTVISKGVNQTMLSYPLNRLLNLIGFYNNTDDRVIELDRALKTYFREVSIQVQGSAVLFTARRAK